MGNIFRVIIVVIGIIAIIFDVLLYNFCERQKTRVDALKNQQQMDSQVEGNKFKYQQDQIQHLSQDLGDAQQQIKDQQDALAQEQQKRQDIEDQSKSIQTSLVDIKAEADAIKQDMKGWQKDYVAVLASLEKKMDDSSDAIKGVKDDLDSFEKTSRPVDNSVQSTPPVSDNQTQAVPSGSL